MLYLTHHSSDVSTPFSRVQDLQKWNITSWRMFCEAYVLCCPPPLLSLCPAVLGGIICLWSICAVLFKILSSAKEAVLALSYPHTSQTHTERLIHVLSVLSHSLAFISTLPCSPFLSGSVKGWRERERERSRRVWNAKAKKKKSSNVFFIFWFFSTHHSFAWQFLSSSFFLFIFLFYPPLFIPFSVYVLFLILPLTSS